MAMKCHYLAMMKGVAKTKIQERSFQDEDGSQFQKINYGCNMIKNYLRESLIAFKFQEFDTFKIN